MTQCNQGSGDGSAEGTSHFSDIALVQMDAKVMKNRDSSHFSDEPLALADLGISSEDGDVASFFSSQGSTEPIIGAANTKCSGPHTITSKDECQRAAKALGKSFTVKSHSARPLGCNLNGKGTDVLFNMEDGPAHKSIRPICKSAPMPAPMPQPRPRPGPTPKPEGGKVKPSISRRRSGRRRRISRRRRRRISRRRRTPRPTPTPTPMPRPTPREKPRPAPKPKPPPPRPTPRPTPKPPSPKPTPRPGEFKVTIPGDEGCLKKPRAQMQRLIRYSKDDCARFKYEGSKFQSLDLPGTCLTGMISGLRRGEFVVTRCVNWGMTAREQWFRQIGSKYCHSMRSSQCVQPTMMADGNACSSDSQCASGRCDGGKCTSMVPVGGGCDTDAECATAVCAKGKCIKEKSIGAQCARPKECASNICEGGACQNPQGKQLQEKQTQKCISDTGDVFSGLVLKKCDKDDASQFWSESRYGTLQNAKTSKCISQGRIIC
eukprot:gnl/MRDRNA2_/MRDRNA2_27033_c0_seq1.p1 gnl/MRDRNA2_/MRDRNA2_27033_c0~~gnl/MRDRNA2_/MRDRNA2_27033_c0_seq1.p1  ORF type:complete len:489 (+),score=58.12 gnl/MRDRNA2_/MRDRNA2_27033_c0_seq1:216-1682(+)